MSVVSMISAISVPIELLSNNQLLGPATAFFYKKNSDYFLVSNWHVFSGRNHETGQPLHSSGAVPDTLRIKIHADEVGAFKFGLRLPLLNEFGGCLWLQHDSGQLYDVACVKCNAPEEGLKFYTIEDHGENSIKISVGQEVMIVGFPRGIAAQGIWPIWKRGTIAAEPQIERIDGLPVYLVDAASREGMSGSPVYLYSSGGTPMEDGSLAFHTGPVARFIGVYSGRVGDEATMQLGRVWHRRIIDEMCGSPKIGNYELKASS